MEMLRQGFIFLNLSEFSNYITLAQVKKTDARIKFTAALAFVSLLP